MKILKMIILFNLSLTLLNCGSSFESQKSHSVKESSLQNQRSDYSNTGSGLHNDNSHADTSYAEVPSSITDISYIGASYTDGDEPSQDISEEGSIEPPTPTPTPQLVDQSPPQEVAVEAWSCGLSL